MVDFKVRVETLVNAPGLFLLSIEKVGGLPHENEVRVCNGVGEVHRVVRKHYDWLAKRHQASQRRETS